MTSAITPQFVLSTAACNFFCGILAQALLKDTFKNTIVVCDEGEEPVSNMDQTLNYIGLKSGY